MYWVPALSGVLRQIARICAAFSPSSGSPHSMRRRPSVHLGGLPSLAVARTMQRRHAHERLAEMREQQRAAACIYWRGLVRQRSRHGRGGRPGGGAQRAQLRTWPPRLSQAACGFMPRHRTALSRYRPGSLSSPRSQRVCTACDFKCRVQAEARSAPACAHCLLCACSKWARSARHTRAGQTQDADAVCPATCCGRAWRCDCRPAAGPHANGCAHGRQHGRRRVCGACRQWGSARALRSQASGGGKGV
jgi:hypothetical protein